MALKDIDFKEYLLQKGERVALIVCAVLGGIFLLLGLVSAVSSVSPEKHAGELKIASEDKQKTLRNASPAADYAPDNPALLARRAETGPVDPAQYALATTPVIGEAVEDTRRRQPRVIFPEEWVHGISWAQLKVINIKLVKDKQTNKDEEYVEIIIDGKGDKSMYRNAGFGQAGRPGMGGRGGMGMGGMAGVGDRGGPGAAGGPGGMGLGGMNFGAKGKKGELSLVRSEDLKDDMKLAERIEARQIVVMVASFPYKRQLEEFQSKLRYASIDEMFRDGVQWPPFKSFDVQRRIVHTTRPGASSGDFESIELTETMQQMLMLAAQRIVDDDESYKSLEFAGLVMPRPVQFEKKLLDGKVVAAYPDVEKQLTLLQKTLQDMKEQEKKATAVPKNQSKFKRERFNPFDPSGQGENAMKDDGSKSTAAGDKPQDYYIPEYCLLRFLDPNVLAGDTYEYRIRFTMVNPNYQKKNVVKQDLAKDEEYTSDWFVIPHLVTVPPVLHYYAVTREPKPDRPGAPVLEPDKDQVCLQIHRWIDSYLPDPSNRLPTSRLEVGDWVIADRVMVYRGEVANRTIPAEVPVWDRQKEEFIIAKDPKNPARRSTPVTFGPERGEVLVIDFDGRDITYKRANGTPAPPVLAAPEEVLLLDPEGRLIVRNKETDEADPDRQERRKYWKDHINDIKNPRLREMMRPGAGGPGEAR